MQCLGHEFGCGHQLALRRSRPHALTRCLLLSQADLEFIYDAIERYSREPPPPPPAHSSNSSHHSSPGNANNAAGDANGGQLLASDSLGRGGRLTPNGVTLLASADPASVSFYSNGGGTLPRLVVTAAPEHRSSGHEPPTSDNGTEPILS